MHFDDRLATVLRSDVGGDRAARTQFRQLLDLLGAARAEDAGLPAATYRALAQQVEGLSRQEMDAQLLHPALERRDHKLLTFLAYHRISELSGVIPAEERSRIIREPGLRLRNRRLVAFLADGDAKPAAAVVATARLTEDDWLALVPQLPVMARGFLRHRRDLPPSVKALLAQMGVRDNVLPLPESAIVEEGEAAEDVLPAVPVPTGETGSRKPAREATTEKAGGIGELRRRIEAFREARRETPKDPQLPLGDAGEIETAARVDTVDFTLDSNGRIDWADEAVAPFLVGVKPGSAHSPAIARLADTALLALDRRQVLRGVQMDLAAPPILAGAWRVDAAPQFSDETGSFTGHVGRMRRMAPPLAATEAPAADETQADRMRQLLHELRTPVNAIQGFAEIIQQQIFGPAPNEYRAHAAAIAVDAAKLLAGFDEVDRLSKLQTGAMELEAGNGDMREVVGETLARLEGVLRSRNSGFQLKVKGDGFSTGIDRQDLLAICWRIFASLAASLAPSEVVKVKLASDGERITMRCRLPASLAACDDILAAPVPDKRPAISAGMFGSGFSLRLARAEVSSAGGAFTVEKDRIVVNLPVLTGGGKDHSTLAGDDDAAA